MPSSKIKPPPKQRKKTATLRETRGLFARHLRQLARQIETIDRLIIERIKADPELSGRFKILQSIPGIRNISSFTLLIEMPELGKLNAKQAASLAGLAPAPRQSGKRRGKEHIAGGRFRVRRAIHMPALSAMCHNKALAAMAETLRGKGKPPKVVIIAIMCKLIVYANALLAKGETWREANI